MNDPNHCGGCGLKCAYGLACCGGTCVDIRNDPHNCGACFEECPGQNRCSYAMCDYGGWTAYPLIMSVVPCFIYFWFSLC